MNQANEKRVYKFICVLLYIAELPEREKEKKTNWQNFLITNQRVTRGAAAFLVFFFFFFFFSFYVVFGIYFCLQLHITRRHRFLWLFILNFNKYYYFFQTSTQLLCIHFSAFKFQYKVLSIT